MSDKLETYRRGAPPKGNTNRLWPLYGAGLENLGVSDSCIDVPLPTIGPDELLVRHDACGLCFSDIKVIRLGQQHPRITKDIASDPVVLGHEVSITVVQVGSSLRAQYRPGDRFIVQAEIYKNGENLAYGYMLQGGLSEYAAITQTILNGDDGNYLLPVQPGTGYAESALTEPWACVTAAYELKYRTGIKPGGALWIIGGPEALDRAYTIGHGFDDVSRPARVYVTHVPPAFEAWLRERAAVLGIPISSIEDVTHPKADEAGPRTNFDGKPAPNHFDDIIVIGPTPELLETVSQHLADFGVCALVGVQPMTRSVNVDVGRVHYNRWVFVGSSSPDLSDAYRQPAVRAALKPQGRAWFVGAGGPMGRMHVQRAIQVPHGPSTIVCTDVSDLRLADLYESYRAEAESQGVELICLNPTNAESYESGMARFREQGFDDIVVLAPVAPLIADSAKWLAEGGVMNVFAGVGRGTLAHLDLDGAYTRKTRIIGHSASSIDDLKLMLHFAESGTLSPNRSVAAIGSLEAVKDGLRSVMDTIYPGKVVIYPHIRPLPLTAVPDLKDVLPTVYAKLKDGREWTNEAEAELLRVMLKDE
jgi:threonine dehydrogenase-like Zn-dependent dehydrogenase